MFQNIDGDSDYSPQIDYPTHWNKVYLNAEVEKLGWYENSPEKTLQLIEQSNIKKDATIFIPGAGATTLIDELLERDFRNLIANDISEEALIRLKTRIGKTNCVQYIIDDLINPKKIPFIDGIDLWVDRAVLHFFLTEYEQKSYFDLLKKTVKPKGYVILAQFNLEGAKKCSGLEVFNYDKHMFQECLGNDFKLINAFDHTYVNPSGGERPYVYALFQRK